MPANNSVVIRFLGDVSSLAKSTAQINGQLAGLGKAATRLSAIFAAGFGLSKVTSTIGDSVMAFSSLQEQIASSGQVFGESSRELVKWAETTGEAFGMNQTEAIKAANQLGMYADAMGLTAEQSRLFAQQMITLSGDLAAFRDTDIDQAIQAIGSAFAGQSRPLRQYTIDTTDAAKVTALHARGIEASVGSMDKATKALGTYYAILDQSTTMQGQAKREQEQTATQMRRLSAVTQELSVAFGAGLNEGMAGFNNNLEKIIQSADASSDAVESFGKTVGQTIGPVIELTGHIADLNALMVRSTGQSLFDAAVPAQIKLTVKQLEGLNWVLDKVIPSQEEMNGVLSGTVAAAIAAGNAMTYYQQVVSNTANETAAVTGPQSIRSVEGLAGAQNELAAATEHQNKVIDANYAAWQKAQAALDKVGGSGGGVSRATTVTRDLTNVLTDLEYTSVKFARNSVELSQKQDAVFEGTLVAFTQKVQKQEKIIADTLQHIQDAADYAQDVLSEFTGVNLDDFIEVNDDGTTNFLADKFNQWVTDRTALAQALGPLATVLPQELMAQIIAMDNAPAWAIVDALDPIKNPDTAAALNANLDTLVSETEKYLLPPMLKSWGYMGDEAAYGMIQSAQKQIQKDSKKFKKFVRNQLDTEVVVKVRYEYINPPNPVAQTQAYEARNGASWRG